MEPAGAPADRSMWPPWRRRRDDPLKADEERQAATAELSSSSIIDSRRRTSKRRRRKTSSRSSAALASALRAGLGVFLFAAVGLWSWDPLKALLLERELRKTGKSGGDDIISDEELRARERVALAAKANLNAAVTLALLSAPASLGNTVGIAAQRMAGAALGCLAAAGVAALGHGAAAAVLLLRRGGAGGAAGAGAAASSPSPSLATPASSFASAIVQATCAVVLGTLAVYLGQRARIQYGAQLFGVSLLFVLAQSGGAGPRELSLIHI